MGIFDKFKSGFKKSASAFSSGLKNIVIKKEIDDKTLDRIEDYLIESDVGIAAASEIREVVSQSKIDPNKATAEEINIILKNYIIKLMKPLENFEIKKIGPEVENHPLFPEKCNVTLATVVDKQLIKVKVWERGAGLTKACGTAACATAFAAMRNGLSGNKVDIEFSTGKLSILIDENNSIHMKGPVSDIKEINIKI